jgi:hypothetical protein
MFTFIIPISFSGSTGYIVTRETCIPTSLTVNNLGKAAVLYLAFLQLGGWGGAKLSLYIIEHNYAYVTFHTLLIVCSPQCLTT